jgi:hypothetical protein
LHIFSRMHLLRFQKVRNIPSTDFTTWNMARCFLSEDAGPLSVQIGFATRVSPKNNRH